jgi:hypothetical protein
MREIGLAEDVVKSLSGCNKRGFKFGHQFSKCPGAESRIFAVEFRFLFLVKWG